MAYYASTQNFFSGHTLKKRKNSRRYRTYFFLFHFEIGPFVEFEDGTIPRVMLWIDQKPCGATINEDGWCSISWKLFKDSSMASYIKWNTFIVDVIRLSGLSLHNLTITSTILYEFVDYNVVWTSTTLLQRWNDVVCFLSSRL